MRESQSSTRAEPHLLYPHDATMPPGKAAMAALQQTIAMFVGCITPALIFSSVVGIDPATQSYLISICLLASGLGTLLQAKRFGIVGSGLLSINGTSFAYVDLLLRAGNEGGLPLACGMALAAVPLQFVLAFSLPALRSIISPLVAGIVVLAIGIDLIPVSGYYIAKGVGETTTWTISTSVAATVIGLADQPGISPEAWQRVATADAVIATASYDGEPGHPVRIDASLWPQLPETGDFGARALLRKYEHLVERIPCSGSPFDIDTTKDLDEWLKQSPTSSP